MVRDLRKGKNEVSFVKRNLEDAMNMVGDSGARNVIVKPIEEARIDPFTQFNARPEEELVILFGNIAGRDKVPVFVEVRTTSDIYLALPEGEVLDAGLMGIGLTLEKYILGVAETYEYHYPGTSVSIRNHCVRNRW